MFMTARARFFFRLLIALAGAAQAFPALADDSAAAPDSVFAYILVACVAAATIVAFLMIRSALYNSTWSLSEEADIGIDKDGKPFLGRTASRWSFPNCARARAVSSLCSG